MHSYDYQPLEKLSGKNRFLATARDDQLKKLLDLPDLYTQQINIEKEVSEEYAGRELLELLQNAADASHKDGSVSVRLEGDILYAENDGHPFTEEGVRSLLAAYNSSKTGKGPIGQKGLGFRALLNLAEYIRIYSGKDLSLELSLKNAKEYYEKMPKKPSAVPPILLVPKVIPPLKNPKHLTTIELKLKGKSEIQEIKDQIADFEPETLIFLHNIARLSFINDGQKTVLSETQGNHSTASLTIDRGGQKTKRTYTILKYHQNNPDPAQELEVTLALPKDAFASSHYLYSYFKTKVEFPTNWFVHANFDLSSSRDSLNETKKNEQLLKVALSLIFKYAETLAKKNVSWAAAESLLGNYEKFASYLKIDNLPIRDYFERNLRALKILPTVNSNYISFNNSPCFFTTRLADHLKGENFKNYLCFAETNELDDFVASFGGRTPGSPEVVPKINALLPKLSVEDRVALSIEFKDTFPDAEEKPTFFLNTKSLPIPSEHDKYSEPTAAIPDLPNFLNLSFVRHDFLDKARSTLGVTAIEFFRTSSKKYADYYQIREYRLDNIVRAYFRTVTTEPVSGRKMAGFIRWLFKNYNNPAQIAANCSYLALPNRAGRLINLKEAYFSGGLYDRLYPGSRDVLPPLETYFKNPEKVDLDAFRDFLSELGVSDAPREIKDRHGDRTLENFGKIVKNSDFNLLAELLLDPAFSWLLSEPEPSRILRITPWIPLGDKTYSPSSLILDPDFKEKFPGLLGVSKSDLISLFSEDLFPDRGLVLNLVSNLDIAEALSDFTPAKIYRVLQALPGADPTGSLAHKIQRDLSRNFSPSEQLSGLETYQDFLKTGKVFCKDGEYHEIADVFYLDDGHLPAASLEGKNLLDTYKKQGAEKMKAIFGVEKLSLDFVVKDYRLSPENDAWQSRLLELKTAAIASETLFTSNENRESLKALKIFLCSSLETASDNAEFVLGDYEFSAPKNSPSSFYLKVPENQTLSRIYSDDFNEAITEIFTLAIGTDFAREQSDSIKILLLYPNPRDYIYKQEDGQAAWASAHEFLTGEQLDLGEAEQIAENYDKLAPALLALELPYRRFLYSRLKSAPPDEKRHFTDFVDDFLNWRPDPKAYHDDLKDPSFEAKGFVLRELLDGLSEAEIPASDAGAGNIERFERLLESEHPDYLPYFEDQELKDLARFNLDKDILAEMAARLEKDQVEEPSGELDEEKDRPALDVAKAVELTGKISLIKSPEKKRFSRGSFGGGGAIEARKKENGRLAQEFAIDFFERQGYHVTDYSSYGNHPEATDAKGYDLEYTDKSGVVHCIEVKSSHSYSRHIEFELSRNEYATALELSKADGFSYEIFYVNGTRRSRQGYWHRPWSEVEGLLTPEEPQKYYLRADLSDEK